MLWYTSRLPVATYSVHVYLLAPTDDFVLHQHVVRNTVYIGAWFVEAEGNDEDVVACRLTTAADDLLQLVGVELVCEVSKPKAAIIASTDKLRARLAMMFGEYDGTLCPTAANLGIAAAAGAAMASFSHASVRKKHNAKVSKRIPRMRRFKMGAGPS